jgi:uncharacterized protein (TIGR00251 family)
MGEPGDRFKVRLTPRGGQERIDGVADGVLRVRVAAPPVDGAANEALVKLLASELGVPRSSVHLVSGATARTKLIEVDGAAALIAARWPGLGERR